MREIRAESDFNRRGCTERWELGAWHDLQDVRDSARETATPIATPAIDHSVARALATVVSKENRLAFARSFTFATARAYAAALDGDLPELAAPSDVSLIPLGAAAVDAAAKFGATLVRAAPASAVYLLGCTYASALPSDFRADHGVFYTPPDIVRHTLDMAARAGIDWRHARCLDPSAGGGAFLVEMIRRLRSAVAGTDPALVLSQIATRLRGYDLDPFSAWLAQTAAHFAVHDLEIAAGRRLPAIVQVRDSLEVRPEDCGAFDLVSSNVPFGRVTLPPERRAFYARSTYGHANLYGLFTDAALHYARKRGVVAFVMPPSMLSGLYYRSLRALLAKEAPPHEITFVTERSGIFEGALQETMLATYSKDRRSRTGAVSFITIDARGSIAGDEHTCYQGTVITAAGRFSLPADRHAPWFLPRTCQPCGARRTPSYDEIPTRELRLRRIDGPSGLESTQTTVSRRSCGGYLAKSSGPRPSLATGVSSGVPTAETTRHGFCQTCPRTIGSLSIMRAFCCNGRPLKSKTVD